MKTNKLTITESIIGWLIDLYMQMSNKEKTEMTSKFHPEVMARKHW